jgi:hypothetical protein
LSDGRIKRTYAFNGPAGINHITWRRPNALDALEVGLYNFLTNFAMPAGAQSPTCANDAAPEPAVDHSVNDDLANAAAALAEEVKRVTEEHAVAAETALGTAQTKKETIDGHKDSAVEEAGNG